MPSSNSIKVAAHRNMHSRILPHLSPYYHFRSLPFQSDTCSVSLPEFDLVLSGSDLGALYTTLEGLLKDVVAKTEDREDMDATAAAAAFAGRLDECLSGGGHNAGFVIVLDDPYGNSYLQV